MNEITNLVAQKTGIPADKAQMAVTTVLDYLKTKLPSPIAGQIDSYLGGGGNAGGSTGGLADAAKSVGGMFGSKDDRPNA